LRLLNAAFLWTALSAVVTPFVGSCLARRHVEVTPEGLATISLSDRGTAAPPDH
jgi:hypothetical protein